MDLLPRDTADGMVLTVLYLASGTTSILCLLAYDTLEVMGGYYQSPGILVNGVETAGPVSEIIRCPLFHSAAYRWDMGRNLIWHQLICYSKGERFNSVDHQNINQLTFASDKDLANFQRRHRQSR